MKKYTLPYFGELNFNNEDDLLIANASFEGNDFELWLDFEDENPPEEQINRVEQFLSQLPSHLEKVKAHLNQELDKSPTFTADYIDSFKETIEENGDTDDYIDKNNSSESIEQQLLNQVHLLRICIYPDSTNFAVLDYTIDDEYTNDLLVVYLTYKGELDGMTIES